MAEDRDRDGDPSPDAEDGDGSEQSAELREELRERYGELLQELRVMLPGVEVLFAFLVTAPFASRFSDLDDVGRAGYAFALVTTALAMVIMMAPVTFHHLTDRHNRRHRIDVAIRLKLTAVVFLALAITSAGFVILRFVFGNRVGLWLIGAVAISMLALWIGLPMVDRRIREESRRTERS